MNRLTIIRFVMLLMAFVAALAGPIAYTRYGGGVACLWLASAVLGSYLVDLPRRAWPPVLVAAGAISATITATLGLGPLAALPLAIINLAEASLFAMALRAGRRDGHKARLTG